MDSTIPLQGQLLLDNQLELTISTTVAGTLYGIAFTLFCLYVHKLAPRLRDEDRKRQARFMLGYSIVLMLCGLYYLVSTAWVVQDAYIKHSNYPGGSFLYIQATYNSTPVTAVAFACQLTVDVLTSAIQIWRVWVIWSATKYANLIIVIPSLSFLAFTALRLRTIILETTISNAEAVVQLDSTTGIVWAAIQGGTTALCTILISAYLIYEQWRQRKLIGKAQGSTGYMKVVAMLIESYALESAWLLVEAIIWNLTASIFFLQSVTYIEIIAYLLVLYRVASGKAYKSQTAGQRNISSLRWNHSNHATTQVGETSEIRGGPHVSTIPEACDAPRMSNMA